MYPIWGKIVLKIGGKIPFLINFLSWAPEWGNFWSKNRDKLGTKLGVTCV